MGSRRRIEALSLGFVAIDADGMRHYAALVTDNYKLRACDEKPVPRVAYKDLAPIDPNVTCLRCASMELP